MKEIAITLENFIINLILVSDNHRGADGVRLFDFKLLWNFRKSYTHHLITVKSMYNISNLKPLKCRCLPSSTTPIKEIFFQNIFKKVLQKFNWKTITRNCVCKTLCPQPYAYLLR